MSKLDDEDLEIMASLVLGIVSDAVAGSEKNLKQEMATKGDLKTTKESLEKSLGDKIDAASKASNAHHLATKKSIGKLNENFTKYKEAISGAPSYS